MKSTIKITLIPPEAISHRSKALNLWRDDYDLQLLTKNIMRNGIIVPLIVSAAQDNRYKVIDGDRRLLAARAARLKLLPCIVTKQGENDDYIRAVLSLFTTKADFFDVCEDVRRAVVNSHTPPELTAESFGLSSAYINDIIAPLLLDNELILKLKAAHLPEYYARALLRIPSDMRKDALDKIIAEDLSKTQTEQLIKSILSPAPKAPERKGAIGDLKLFDNTIGRMVYTLNLSGIKAGLTVKNKPQTVEYKITINRQNTPAQCSFAEQL